MRSINIAYLYINIHTHFPAAANETAIVSFYENFERVTANGSFSIGIHPCFTPLAKMHELTSLCTHAHVLAIGECGLDKLCSTDFSLQKKLFKEQIQLAGSIGKPLLIHCVKTFDEVMQLLQEEQCKVPVIFHGFNKSKELALQLTAKGYYLSFGKALQHERTQETFSAVPVEQVFLETDTAAISIETIYELAAKAMKIDLNTFSLQIEKNAVAVFGTKLIRT